MCQSDSTRLPGRVREGDRTLPHRAMTITSLLTRTSRDVRDSDATFKVYQVYQESYESRLVSDR
jgi:hypothetical protein